MKKMVNENKESSEGVGVSSEGVDARGGGWLIDSF